MNQPFALLLLTLFVFAIGCEDPPEIRQYRVAKERSDLGDIGNRRITLPPDRAEVNESRMVVAIAERDDATWFFKIAGPKKAVTESQPQWNELLSKIEFDDAGQPTWTVPENWSEGEPRQMRYATLLTKVDGEQVEMSISSLGPNQNLLDNINRWRRQIALPPIGEDQLKLGTLNSASGELSIFDETGMTTTSMSVPTIPRMPKSEFAYEIADGWTKGKTNSIVKVRLRHGDEQEAPQISVTQLLAAANDWTQNAERWANQVGMKTEQEFLAERTTDVSVDNIAGKKIRLIPSDESNEIAIIAVMINRGELAWFFKFVGDRDFVRDNESVFDDFVSSFQFK